MNLNPNQLRLARMERECDVSCVPALLLLAGCATMILVLAIGNLQPEAVTARGGEAAGQTSAPARLDRSEFALQFWRQPLRAPRHAAFTFRSGGLPAGRPLSRMSPMSRFYQLERCGSGRRYRGADSTRLTRSSG